jgi:mono/diheme cytochrome c family protein
MPKFQGKLTDEEIRQVVAYVEVLPHAGPVSDRAERER